MKREDDPQLWELLGHSKVPEPSPFFARNVLRAVRNESREKPLAFSWWRFRRLIPAISAAVLLAASALTFHSLQRHHSAGNNEAIAQDSELAADLDLLAQGDDDNDDSSLL
jgi:hypothetical protein